MEVLVIRHTSGHWGFPKGHKEDQETAKETAIRETKEETGYDVVITDGFKRYSRYNPREEVMKTVTYFIGKVVAGEPKPTPEEISEVRWVSLSDAQMMLTYPSDVEVLRRAVTFIEAHSVNEADC